LLLIALSTGIFGLGLFTFVHKYQFLLFCLPNFSLAAFFGYKYYTYDKAMQKEENRKRERRVKDRKRY